MTPATELKRVNVCKTENIVEVLQKRASEELRVRKLFVPR